MQEAQLLSYPDQAHVMNIKEVMQVQFQHFLLSHQQVVAVVEVVFVTQMVQVIQEDLVVVVVKVVQDNLMNQ